MIGRRRRRRFSVISEIPPEELRPPGANRGGFFMAGMIHKPAAVLPARGRRVQPAPGRHCAHSAKGETKPKSYLLP
jgi:hypothetical protein